MQKMINCLISGSFLYIFLVDGQTLKSTTKITANINVHVQHGFMFALQFNVRLWRKKESGKHELHQSKLIAEHFN